MCQSESRTQINQHHLQNFNEYCSLVWTQPVCVYTLKVWVFIEYKSISFENWLVLVWTYYVYDGKEKKNMKWNELLAANQTNKNGSF